MNSIINSGITKIVYDANYDASLSKEIVNDTNIEVVKYEGRSLQEILIEMGYINIEEKTKSR